MKREKTSAQEDLKCLKKENNNFKDKEKTMLDIFVMLKKFVDIDVETEKTKTKEANSTNGATAAPSPFKCLNFNFVSTRVESLNKHVREEHIATKFPCLTSDFQAQAMNDLRKHQLEEHNSIGANAKKRMLSCNLCGFKTSSENN